MGIGFLETYFWMICGPNFSRGYVSVPAMWISFLFTHFWMHVLAEILFLGWFLEFILLRLKGHEGCLAMPELSPPN